MKTNEIAEKLQNEFHGTGDLLLREVPGSGISCLFCYVDSLTDKLLLEQDIIAPVCACARKFKDKPQDEDGMRGLLLSATSFCQDVTVLPYRDAVRKIAEGDVAFFAEGYE